MKVNTVLSCLLVHNIVWLPSAGVTLKKEVAYFFLSIILTPAPPAPKKCRDGAEFLLDLDIAFLSQYVLYWYKKEFFIIRIYIHQYEGKQ